MSEAYVRMLGDQIDQLNNDMSRKTEYIRGNKTHILYGIIRIILYMSVLSKRFNTPFPVMNELFTKMGSLIGKLKNLEPDIVLPNFAVAIAIIALFMDSIVDLEYGINVEENIRRGLLPIDLSDSGNFNNNRDGSILNNTEHAISRLLSFVREILRQLNTNSLTIIISNDTNKNFFKILLGLMISMGRNTDITSINQLVLDFFSAQPQLPQPPPPQPPPPPPKVEQVDDTQEYATQLVERIRCPICLTNERHIALDCGHTICPECAQNTSLINCPECRKPITQRKKIFYNKYLKYKTKYAQLKKLNKEF